MPPPGHPGGLCSWNWTGCGLPWHMKGVPLSLSQVTFMPQNRAKNPICTWTILPCFGLINHLGHPKWSMSCHYMCPCQRLGGLEADFSLWGEDLACLGFYSRASKVPPLANLVPPSPKKKPPTQNPAYRPATSIICHLLQPLHHVYQKSAAWLKLNTTH